MKFVTDPSIPSKIEKMKQRVRWRESAIVQRKIDQTRLVLEDGQDDRSEFSFLVLGDSGTGAHRGYDPQRRIAEMMAEQREDCRFVLHTGDVVYLVGSSEYYPQNFVLPYREFLVDGDRAEKIRYDQMRFNLPFLPVLGNHDYYDLPILFGALAQSFYPVRRLLRSRIDFDIGWHGSYQGGAYAKAFIDCLSDLRSGQTLAQHLDQHYTAQWGSDRCLSYQPKLFTRLPNRYYRFRVSGIDFFALDSNTFNAPAPLPDTPAGQAYREVLEQRRKEVNAEQQMIVERLSGFRADLPHDSELIDDQRTKLEQLEEVERDIDQQLETRTPPLVDDEQLKWLEQGLIESWNTDDVRGRVLFFHHPPYVTEATKWHQAQTLAVRQRMRQVFENVAKSIAERAANRSIVDLILNGHAHCLEHLKTESNGLADAGINCIVCGGSGYSLRRQRIEGTMLNETLVVDGKVKNLNVAQSHLYVGRTGQGLEKRRPYSFLRIDVQEGNPPRFVVRPFVAERYRKQWESYPLQPFTI
ncbi:metallophosphoesterase [Leptolyngbya sp. FACHB-711]|uniref:metallophosphoesterase family protein n=1 Tax=unclassified Leptolyngbya TaxID=2650499 RepID=UPI00168A1995|nr:metallophosphoesterase [Leptolyngbya sp. FACHB-711]MBD1850502.1 metallophosphoesterase [Cyanobacteria bacterium FACHB-502]MBD2023870.1 metallophosphoesterase [Leptolyngbya sp. FACHB-711]